MKNKSSDFSLGASCKMIYMRGFLGVFARRNLSVCPKYVSFEDKNNDKITHRNHFATGSFGFTLTELLTVVGILGILSIIGIPQYTGYIDASRKSVAQNNLRLIYLEQQEYFASNNVYYATNGLGVACTDATANTAAINTNLFAGKSVLKEDDYTYCISQTATSNFIAQADQVSGAGVLTINQNNVSNF